MIIDWCGDRDLYFCLCARRTHTGILGADMMTNFEVRVLLVLWDLGGESITARMLNDRFNCKTPASKKKETREKLMADGAIGTSADGKGFTLTDAGKTLLTEALTGDEFLFDGKIMGTKLGNALLKWYRSQPTDVSVVKDKVNAIESYEAFKVVALEVYDRLNRDYNLDNLVPIYRIRRTIGDRVSRSEFGEWLFEMQVNDHFELLEGTVEDSAPDKLEDSVTTNLGKLRCYAKRLDI